MAGLPMSIKLTLQECHGEQCVHHWILEPAKPRRCRGKCKLCGALRTFTPRFAEPSRPQIGNNLPRDYISEYPRSY